MTFIIKYLQVEFVIGASDINKKLKFLIFSFNDV